MPEFAIWAELGEHAATRTAIGEVGTQMASGIAELATDVAELRTDIGDLGDAIRSIERRGRQPRSTRIGTRSTGSRRSSRPGAPSSTDGGAALAGGAQPRGPVSGLRAAVSWANAGILGEPIIPADPERYPADLTIPRVGEIYVNPRYRVAKFDPRLRPEVTVGDSHHAVRGSGLQTTDGGTSGLLVTTSMSCLPPMSRRRTRRGCPCCCSDIRGPGKSLLTKVFAARLPDSEYTVVRVPLRRVSADAPIHRQIEEALEISTDQRIEWWDLAQQSTDTVRVVLLDGLDELLQASDHDRSRYLEDVLEFQEREANQRRPVVVIVTSRTVVADRVRIPRGTTIVKLDSFTADDVADWVVRWNLGNADAIAAGSIGELTLQAARRQPELAEQPLLLLMLALYAADRTLPPLDEDMATAELYRRLLDGFARREAGKDLGLGHDPSPDELEQRAQDHLDRLAVAALGMFNRGRQDIREEELGKDLEALEPRLMERSRAVEAGRRIIGEFFFVHAPEARMSAGHGDEERPRAQGGQPERAYEFLHATFGEYLVARRVMDELVDVAVKAFSGRRPAEPDDDLLFALLSHQVLAARRSMLDFAIEIFSGLDDSMRQPVLEALGVLIRTYRNRHGSDRYAAYRPVPTDQVRQLACYSANLVALRVELDIGSRVPEPHPSGIPLAELLRVPGPSRAVLEEWKVTPLLWKAGLDTDGLRAMLTHLEVAGSSPRLDCNKRDLGLMPSELLLARLTGDEVTERRLRYGTAIYDEVSYYFDDASWTDMMRSWLIPAIAGIDRMPASLPAPPTGTPYVDITRVAGLIFKYLLSSPYDESRYIRVLQLLFKILADFQLDIDKLALTAAAIGRPSLREAVPELQNFEIYGYYAEIVRHADNTDLLSKDKDQMMNWQYPSDHVVDAVKDVLEKGVVLRWDDDELPATAPGFGREPGAEGFRG